MRSFPGSPRHCKLAPTLILAALGLLSSSFAAQQPGNPPPAPEPPPAPAVFQNPIPGAQLAFLNDYGGRMTNDVLKDKRFHKLMKKVVPSTTYHYGRDMPLMETVETLLDGAPLPVDIRDGRYVMVASQGGPYLSGKGFLWFDMQDGIALGGVYFHPVNGEPTPTLAIFSRQLQDTSLWMGQLPPAFVQDVAQWALIAGPQLVSPRYFIPANGWKYPLLHDEDYCAHPADAPAPPQDRCEELNAEAADADMEAAWFMEQSRNAANATAWKTTMGVAPGMAPGLGGWIAVRDKRCRSGPNRLQCRIQMTRQQTQTLLTQH